MKSLLFFFLGFTSIIYGQVEHESSLLTNPSLQKDNQRLAQKSSITFDSTFIYITDTIVLPFFDDFSKNKFQKYNANFTDAGVSSQEFFALLDGSNIPLIAGSKFSTVPTYRRYVDVANSSFSDTNFTTVNIQVGSLISYPVAYNGTALYPPYIVIDTIDYPNPLDTIYLTDNIIEQDSATQFFKQVSDPKKLWLEERAYHNYRYAKDPWTIGVATFDGLNEHGYPYSFGSNGSDYADVLTSKPINLSINTPGDSLYFSFLYQKQGFGDEPETSDSLILELFNPTLNAWKWVWSTNGGPVSDFKPVRFPVVNPDYFANGFQFRFKNYGSLTGGLDHFHLDYVTVASSTFDDSLFRDFAFVYPTGSLLKDYTSVPWDHYKNNSAGKMNDSTLVVVRNGSNTLENNQNGSVQISYGGVVEGNFTLIAQDLSGGAINYSPKTTYFTYHDLSGGYQFDISKPGTKQTFDIRTEATAQFTDSTVNDTTYTQQYFANYYAYDDGTAERAYSFTGAQGRLAMRFNPYESDSLIGASIHFTPTVQDAEGDLFVLTVWDDNNGVPGTVLYQDNLFFPKEVQYVLGSNRFANYFFDDTTRVPVGGTFYIGWRQFDPSPLNVGLDKNIDKSENLFYSLNGGNSWTNSSIDGTVMIRPIFSTSLNAELSISEKTKPQIEYILYPNPSSGQVYLNSNFGEVEGMEIFSVQGQSVLVSTSAEADITHLQDGIYFVRPFGSQQTIRLIKK